MTSWTPKSAYWAIFFLKHVMWRHVMSVCRIFKKYIWVNLRIWYLNSVNFLGHSDHFWPSSGCMSIFAYFAFLAFSGILMAVFSWKMFGLTQIFYRFKILVRGTCSDSFCENLSRWRLIRTPDVISHGEKSIWNKCWRQQKWVKVGNFFFAFQNLWSHTFLTNWYPGQINKPFKCY